jgi:hypothetical protein
VPVAVALRVGVGVRPVGLGVRVGVGVGLVGLGMRLGVIVGVAVGDGLSVEVPVGLGVRLGVTVDVRVQVDVGPGAAVSVRVEVDTGLGWLDAVGKLEPGTCVDVGAGEVTAGVVIGEGVTEAPPGSTAIPPSGRRTRNRTTANRMAIATPLTIAQAGSRPDGAGARGTATGVPPGLRRASASLYLGQETQSSPRQAVPW